VKTGGTRAGSRGLVASVQHPFALLTGTTNITKNGSMFSISCPHCNLTFCVDSSSNGSLLLVKQSPYISVPRNFTGPWDHDRGLRVTKLVKAYLVIEKEFVGLLVAGIISATGIVPLALWQPLQWLALNPLKMLIM
jgi:hypothetical protein